MLMRGGEIGRVNEGWGLGVLMRGGEIGRVNEGWGDWAC